METFSSSCMSWGAYECLTQAQFTPFHNAGIEFLHAQLFSNRGITSSEEIHAFLDARLDQTLDPLLLIDMQPALARVQRALDTGEHITIYGDFDADGVTSAALLLRALRPLKQSEACLDAYLPSRLLGERGLSKHALDRLKQRGTSLIITTDCGSSDVEAVAYARELAMDVIITDHHHPPAELPQAMAILNPWRADCTYGERYLCGVGIAFKLAQALYQAYGRAQADVWELLDLVAIGTIGDVATLLGENHTLVRHGMQRLNATKNAGLQALIEVTRLTPGKIRTRDISFVLAPRLNAAGRMHSADLALELLVTDDSTEASKLAIELDQLNRERQELTEKLMKVAREQAQTQTDKTVILVHGAKEEWPEGIIGLAAGKLAEEMQRPVFVLSQDSEVSRGSARSQENFNLILALQAARPDLFQRYGGHAQAAGFTIANTHIDELHEHILHCYAQMHDTQAAVVATENLGIELEAAPALAQRQVDVIITKPDKQLTLKNLEKIQQLAPFGAGNPEPIFRLDDAQLVKCWASGNEGRHLRVRLRCQTTLFEGILLRGGERAAQLLEGSQVQVIFALEQAWNPVESEARPKVQLRILDIIMQIGHE
ncbi:MAG: single-stranded-DNA-specific exonuclease RecJ [Ktedonobacteraceae bacterium]